MQLCKFLHDVKQHGLCHGLTRPCLEHGTGLLRAPRPPPHTHKHCGRALLMLLCPWQRDKLPLLAIVPVLSLLGNTRAHPSRNTLCHTRAQHNSASSFEQLQ